MVIDEIKFCVLSVVDRILAKISQHAVFPQTRFPVVIQSGITKFEFVYVHFPPFPVLSMSALSLSQMLILVVLYSL